MNQMTRTSLEQEKAKLESMIAARDEKQGYELRIEAWRKRIAEIGQRLSE